MKIAPTAIPDALIIEPQVFGDHRGFFMETWSRKKFQEAGLNFDFVQDNHSSSVKGTLRGLHYQTVNTQVKLVRVTAGKVFDVAVDIRRSSPTFGKWVGEILSAENRKMFWVPPGFAHGFLVLSDVAEFQYKCTDFYNPAHEKCIVWNDPRLNIAWPLENGLQPILSEKDKAGRSFAEVEVFP
ncbi:dTDP-4-dehydrorhamnose 3,5-epimerase [Erysipelotrichia bacterium]